MDSKLEMARHPAEQTSRTAAVGGSRQKPTKTTAPCTAAAPAPGKVGFAAPEDRISVDPLRGTDRYRLVMPYSLRV